MKKRTAQFLKIFLKLAFALLVDIQSTEWRVDGKKNDC